MRTSWLKLLLALLISLFLVSFARAEGKLGLHTLSDLKTNHGYRVWGSIDEKGNSPVGFSLFGQYHRQFEERNLYFKVGPYVNVKSFRVEVFAEKPVWTNGIMTINRNVFGIGLEKKLW